jgi:hypothetical protein
VTEIEAAHAIGNYGSLFTLHAEFVVDDDDDDDDASALLLAAAPLLPRPMSAGARNDGGGASSSPVGSAPEIALRVREATPAIDAATTYSVDNSGNDDDDDDDGSREVANVNEEDIATMLVSDMEGILLHIKPV